MRTLFQLVAFLFVAGVFASTPSLAQFKIPEGDGGPASSAGDSTSFLLEERTGDEIILGTGTKDTTAWYDLRSRRFPDCGFIGQPLIKGVLETTAIAGDSLLVTLEWSSSADETNNILGTAVTFIGLSPTTGVFMTCDTHANSPALGFRYVRFIIEDDDASRAEPFIASTFRPIFITSN